LEGFQINMPTAIRFGSGMAQQVADMLPAPPGRVLLLRGKRADRAAPVVAQLEQAGFDIHPCSVTAEPSLDSINTAANSLQGQAFCALVACGGGAVIDTAKALRFCLESGSALPERLDMLDPTLLAQAAHLPLIVLPSTAGTGAEVTGNAVLGTADGKLSLRGRHLFPSAALVDPSLLSTGAVPAVIGAGLDALTQTIEAHTSCYATPFTSALTGPNLRRGAQALRRIVERDDRDARTDMAWLSLSSGLALANGGLGAAHGLAAVLGGALSAPHGMLCGRLLAPVLLQNRAYAALGTESFLRIEQAIDALEEVFPKEIPGAPDLSGVEAWLSRQQVPRLREFAPDRASLDAVAVAAMSASSSLKNAVPLPLAAYHRILDAAF
jgi:alcohol dehydrogenase class IV